uniref:Uncharacterized protein n=1 Tax=Cyanophora sudae TaxID=1522369 RepID=A0A2Z4HG55_9EUKA|nr:hypothetical protein [Cyanophora sudae]AWW13728.1 hypothetical protein [Cyanophora sudae]
MEKIMFSLEKIREIGRFLIFRMFGPFIFEAIADRPIPPIIDGQIPISDITQKPIVAIEVGEGSS